MSEGATLFITENIQHDSPETRVWPDVLDAIYSHGGTAWLAVSESGTRDWSPEASQLFDQVGDVREREFFRAINLLQRVGLVKYEMRQDDEYDFVYLFLTEKGFDVAHDRELEDRHEETNSQVAFFTLILGFAAIIQGTASVLQIGDPGVELGLLLVILAITLTISLYQSKIGERISTTIDAL